MFGVSLDGPQVVVVLEYCAGGNTHTKHTHTHITHFTYFTFYTITQTSISLIDMKMNEFVKMSKKRERSVTQTDEYNTNQTNCESTLNRLKLKKSHTRHIQLNMID
jgi:hypothetical protein